MATDGAKRLEFFLGHVWLIRSRPWSGGRRRAADLDADRDLPVAVPLAQTARPRRSGRAMRWLVLGSVLMVYASYWFVMESWPQAHAVLRAAPIVLQPGQPTAGRSSTHRAGDGLRRQSSASTSRRYAGLAVARAPRNPCMKHRDIVVDAIQTSGLTCWRTGARLPWMPDRARRAADIPRDPGRDIAVRDATFAALWHRGALDRHHRQPESGRRLSRHPLIHDLPHRERQGSSERHEFIKDIFMAARGRAWSS